ncbi:MAG TPA: DUF4129 domain-containing protein [Pirellulaceae bacterium]|jgi:hypothetical protein
MAKKLYMTTADYLVIAVSPALIMTLVGSLVYFLIEVFYAGQYEARLDYAFGLFVLAAVLIARISIEEGREYAAMFAAPLAIVMFLFLMRFVEHPSPYTHLINLLLMAVVWWCADRLTWDSTVIDDDEDASGEGLMQRIGVDGPETAVEAGGGRAKPASDGLSDGAGNELLEAGGETGATLWQRLMRLVKGRKGPHTPGIWVLYFSLGALPLFGVGQHFIPTTDVGRRRYVFFLLLVYVASALALLVTTSFLNLRRYLRQRRIEMPLPIAGTWAGVGAVLIVIVMMLAMLIPRPGAEVAISQMPWQAGSPGGMSASQASVNRDGGAEQGDRKNPTPGEATTEKGQGTQPPNGQPNENKSPAQDGKEPSDKGQGKGDPSSQKGKEGKKQDPKGGETSSGSQDKPPKPADGKDDGKKQDSDKGGEPQSKGQSKSEKPSDQKDADAKTDGSNSTPPKESEEKRSEPKGSENPTASAVKKPLEIIQNVASTVRSGFGAVLKLLFYVVAGIFLAVVAWRYRQQILQAISDILRMLRELFGGRRTTAGPTEEEKKAAGPRPRSFSEFRDPFLSGQQGQMPPEELVRYTFAAFEAWANDRGRPRTPDCTPLELLSAAVEPKTPLHNEARKLVRLYGELAYASRRVPRQAADDLREVWLLMRSTGAAKVSTNAKR